ncbi:MAG: glutathione S-transferase family protein [Alphaproteobacteria bacterium]
MTIELYHNDKSTCSQKVRLCLAEKSLDWVNRHVNIAAEENLTPQYLKLNPNGVVPTLVHDGAPIAESTVICEYLEETHPEAPHLSPRDPLRRAQMRVWLRYNDEVPSMAIRVPTFQHVILPRYQKMSEAEFEAFVERNPLRKPFLKRLGRTGFSRGDYDMAIEQLHQSLERMETVLGESQWLVDGEYSIADICIAPILQRLEDLGMASMWTQSRPGVAGWYERIRARPAYRVAFYKGSLLAD